MARGSGVFATQQILGQRDWSILGVKADVGRFITMSTLPPNSEHQPSALPCPLSAIADMVGKTT